jgi:hypothetical protein
MGLFAQGNRSLCFGWPVIRQALIFLIFTVFSCIAVANEGGAFASFEVENGIKGPASPGDSTINEPHATAAVKIPAAIKRGFYLTANSYAANEVFTACSKGYHMASVWELLDVSSLNYHYKHPNAMKNDDSGSGPPSAWGGWARSGYLSSNSNIAGFGNCNNWTSDGNADRGTTLHLGYSTSGIPGCLVEPYQCDNLLPVWCISNVK